MRPSGCYTAVWLLHGRLAATHHSSGCYTPFAVPSLRSHPFLHTDSFPQFLPLPLSASRALPPGPATNLDEGKQAGVEEPVAAEVDGTQLARRRQRLPS